jgi:hypothetical protein
VARRGIATDALRRNLGKAFEAATGRGRGAWDKQIGGGFGSPGAERRIRQYPVSEQERIIAGHQARDTAKRKPAVRKAYGNVVAAETPSALSEAVEELMPTALNTPSHSTNTRRPRALRGGYDSRSGTVRVQFRDGAVYEYFGVPKKVWSNGLRRNSFGRFVNDTLDTYPYTRVDPTTMTPIGMFSTNAPEFSGLFENPTGALPEDETPWAGYTAPRAGSGWFRR